MTTTEDKYIEKLNLISAAMVASHITVVKLARFHNTPIVSFKDGKIVKIDPYSIRIEGDKP